METIKQKKQEILDCIYDEIEKPNIDTVETLLNELISICRGVNCNDRCVLINGIDIVNTEIVNRLVDHDKRIIIIGDNRTQLPKNDLLKDGKVFDIKTLPTLTECFIDDNKSNEKWYRKFENKKRKR